MDMNSGMDMSGMDMGSDGSSMIMPLNTTGVDFTNATQASDFLSDLLDDTELQVIGNQYAVYFWYGIVVMIALVALINAFRVVALRIRYVNLRNSLCASSVHTELLKIATSSEGCRASSKAKEQAYEGPRCHPSCW